MIRVEPLVEKWQVIENFPQYEISERGLVRIIDSGIIVPPAKFNDVNYVELMRDGKAYLMHVNRMRWRMFPTGANPPLSPHGMWLGDRYEDGEKEHLCGVVCSVGAV